MRKIISLLEESTGGSCYTSYRYCADDELRIYTINYEESQGFTLQKERFGETDKSLKTTKDLSGLAKRISKEPPLFKYFLDGSRRTYKIDDLEINKRIFPLMAGQVGVACCERLSPSHFKCKEIESHFALAIPKESIPSFPADLFLNNLRDKLNEVDKVKKTGLAFSRVFGYDSKSNSDEETNKFEHLGVAAIQDDMIESEKRIVAKLAAKNLLNEDNFLIKDGSLQYKPMKTGEYKELSKIKNNYRWVVGVSKLFNPEFSKDRNGKSNAAALAKLKLYHRSPAYMFQHDREKWSYLGDFKYSVWYVRIRDAKHTESPFAGIVKIEKILITDIEIEEGLDTELVDLITANIINERNPVCYGKDNRWANHLYPIYLTEQFLKSRYLSDIHFLNLF